MPKLRMFTHLSTIFLFGITMFLLNVSAQDTSVTRVNILFIYQETEGERLFDAALQFIDKNRNLNIEVGRVHKYFANANLTVPVQIQDFCKVVDESMSSDDRPDVAIDFTRIGGPSESVKVVLKTIQMPTISATFGQEGDVREWRDLTEEQQQYMIQVSPPADLLIQSVRSIVGLQAMTSAVVLFDEHFEMYHKYKSLLQNMPTRHLLTAIKKPPELAEQITKLVKVDIVNFFIAATLGEITEVLAKASKPTSEDGPYFSDEFAWYSMSLTGENNVPKCSGCQMNVSLVHLSPEPFKDTKMEKRKNFLQLHLAQKALTLTEMFYLDISLDAIFAVANLKKAGKWDHDISNNSCGAKGARDPGQGLAYPSLNLNLFDEFKNSGKENIMGEFHLEKNGRNYPNFKMEIQRLFYDANSGEPKEKKKIGVWTAGYVDTDPEKLISENTLADWKAHRAETVFRIVTVEQSPFIVRKNGCVEDPKNDKYRRCFYGYCIALLEKIQSELHFNYTIRAVKGYGYMSEKEPHEWDGMVKELKERRADIALGAMSVMAERESVVDFTVPYYDLVGISILMKKPKTPTSLFKFLTVLENDVWMCILGAYFFTSILMWIFDRWSPYSYQNNREKYEDDEEKREFNLKECLWFCMTSLTPQGGGEAPKNLSGRLVAATWWLFGFIIIASYTANLAAFLTVSRLDAPIESLEDLAKQYKVQFAPLNGSSAWIYFNRMANIEKRFYNIWKDMSLNDSLPVYERAQLAVWEYPVSDKYTKMWQAMKENHPPNNFTEAVDRVRGLNLTDPKNPPDAFAFLGDATDIRFQVLTSCDLQMVGEEFSRKPYALAVQQGSPLKDQLNDAILKLLNQRYLEQLKEEWWNDNALKKDCPREDNQADGISIHNIGGVFIVIFVGIVMACFTLIFEYWWYRKKNATEQMAEMALPPPKEFAASTFNRGNFNTQYDKPPQRNTLPPIENSW